MAKKILTAAEAAIIRAAGPSEPSALAATGKESKETIEVTETKTKTAKTAKTTAPKTAKPKTAKPKTAKTTAKPKTAKPKTAKANGDQHAFIASKSEPAKCSVCSGAPSDKRHRRALDAMRAIWRKGTHTEKALHLTHIGFDGSDAKAEWTALTVEVKHLLAAELFAKAEAK